MGTCSCCKPERESFLLHSLRKVPDERCLAHTGSELGLLQTQQNELRKGSQRFQDTRGVLDSELKHDSSLAFDINTISQEDEKNTINRVPLSKV